MNVGRSRSARAGAGALQVVAAATLGALPGLLALVLVLLGVSGEARLSLAIGAIVLAVAGVAAGVATALRRAGQAGRMALGAVAGAVPGVALAFVFTRVAVLVLVAGAVAGALLAGRRERAAPDR